jgi:hypothetical protein
MEIDGATDLATLAKIKEYCRKVYGLVDIDTELPQQKG